MTNIYIMIHIQALQLEGLDVGEPLLGTVLNLAWDTALQLFFPVRT